MVIGPGRAHLMGCFVCCAQELRIFNKDRLLAGNGANDRRDARVVAVANSDGLTLLEIDAGRDAR